MLLKKLAPIVTALAIVGGAIACIVNNTGEAAAAALASKEVTPLSEFADLKNFPAADQWRVLFQMSQGAWYDTTHGHKVKEAYDTDFDNKIVHIFAYLPAGVPVEMEEMERLPKSSSIALNMGLRCSKLPEVRSSTIAHASKGRYCPYPRSADALWFEVDFYELKDGVRFVHLVRIPYAHLHPAAYHASHPEFRDER